MADNDGMDQQPERAVVITSYGARCVPAHLLPYTKPVPLGIGEDRGVGQHASHENWIKIGPKLQKQLRDHNDVIVDPPVAKTPPQRKGRKASHEPLCPSRLPTYIDAPRIASLHRVGVARAIISRIRERNAPCSQEATHPDQLATAATSQLPSETECASPVLREKGNCPI